MHTQITYEAIKIKRGKWFCKVWSRKGIDRNFIHTTKTVKTRTEAFRLAGEWSQQQEPTQ